MAKRHPLLRPKASNGKPSPSAPVAPIGKPSPSARVAPIAKPSPSAPSAPKAPAAKKRTAAAASAKPQGAPKPRGRPKGSLKRKSQSLPDKPNASPDKATDCSSSSVGSSSDSSVKIVSPSGAGSSAASSRVAQTFDAEGGFVLKVLMHKVFMDDSAFLGKYPCYDVYVRSSETVLDLKKHISLFDGVTVEQMLARWHKTYDDRVTMQDHEVMQTHLDQGLTSDTLVVVELRHHLPPDSARMVRVGEMYPDLRLKKIRRLTPKDFVEESTQ